MPRYRFEIDYESETEWGIGVAAGLDSGATATHEEMAFVLEAMAALLRVKPTDTLPVRYLCFGEGPRFGARALPQ